MKAVHLLAACFVLLAVFLVGCNRDAGKPSKDKEHKDHKDEKAKDHAKDGDHKDHKGEKKGDGHAHKPAAHGGKVVSVGTDSYHAEVVFEKDGHLKFYTLGKDESKSISVETQTVKAHAKAEGGDKSHEMELKPEPQKDDAKGKTSLFVGKLPAEVIGKKVTVTIVGLKMEGETFRVEFSSEGGDHKDHKDKKEHKDHKKEQTKGGHSSEDEIKEARAKLTDADRKLVDAQEWCVVMTDNRLGEMGVPFKVMVKDQPVFVCCKGCQRKALADAEATLKKVDEFKAKVKTQPPRKSAVKVGDKVPDFSITTLDGKSVKLSELQKDETRTKKGIVVLSYWCATCHSCRHVEGALGKLAKDYAGEAAVIALDANADDTTQAVAAFVKKNGLTMPVAFDPNGQTADVFGIKKTTTTVVIDGNGVLRYCGQLKQKGGASAEGALKAVLAGNEVAVKTTPHNG
ncbi:MAG: TlpA family protein disulfide reductase [Planctomycetes bacterium]|nr:TlpA family protein disulfide reductase [Planctomycetota bacterium]